MGVTHVNNENFKTEVLEAELPVLVDFFADWCGPCKMIGPSIEELANEYDGKMKICKLNIDEGQDLAAQFNVMTIPTLIFFKGGQKVDQIVGALPKPQLEEAIQKHL
ncbi:thioredoxin [Candidatus Omnitrophota bacterium]